MNLSDILIPDPEVLVLALFIDVLLGEPPAALHPVVWMGTMIHWLKERGVGDKRVFGAVLAIFLVVVSILAGAAVMFTASLVPDFLGLLLAAYFLKSTFSLRMLLTSARQISTHLGSGALDAARQDLKGLVSRDTAALDEPQIASAVIESTSENFVDGIMSPLCFYLILGLPGALAYRSVNTLDSMIGYRNREYMELGRASARLDDLLNWVPARLSVIFILAASLFTGSPVKSITTCLKDSKLTPSPNSGWPMAATAGALKIRLNKQGHYELGGEFRQPHAADIGRSTRLIGLATVFLFTFILAVSYIMKILI